MTQEVRRITFFQKLSITWSYPIQNMYLWGRRERLKVMGKRKEEDITIMSLMEFDEMIHLNQILSKL